MMSVLRAEDCLGGRNVILSSGDCAVEASGQG